jgi:hypothetical protein
LSGQEAPVLNEYELVQAIADFIRAYRAAQYAPQTMLESVLAAFPDADANHYARALITANRRRAANG